jgi:phytoene desaturase
MTKKICIIGAGVGGLGVAARLASRGYKVEVYEKLPECGGRAHIIEDKGFKFDTGPSFVLMPDFYEEVFSYCGQDLKDYLDLKVLDISYKIFYPDRSALTIYRDSEKTKIELERFEKGSAHAYDKFIEKTEDLYKAVKPLLYKYFRPRNALNPHYWGLINKLKVGQSYWQLAKKFFKSDELCYTFTFEAMFIGVSPFDAPAFYSIITYVDHVQKIYHPMGGMYQIPRALEKLAKKFGVTFHYDSEINKIKHDRDCIILEMDESEIETDKVVVNADYAYTQDDLLRRHLPRFKYSCSVYLLYLGIRKKVEGLEHHNLFFAKDLKKNLDQIFKDKVIPDDPSFYIHVPTVTDTSLAPLGKDIVYILVPVPNLNNPREEFAEHEDRLRRIIFDRINEMLDINLEDLIEVEHKFYPQDFINRYNIKYGATFGLAHNLMQSAFFRPPNIDSRIKNLYYVGASTQPGGGLPPVIASSRVVADLIAADGNKS